MGDRECGGRRSGSPGRTAPPDIRRGGRFRRVSRLVLAAALAACAPSAPGGGAPGPDGSERGRLSGADATAEGPAGAADGLEIALRTDRSVYEEGDSVRLALLVTNGTADTLRLSFPSAQRYEFVVRSRDGADPDAGDVAWRWSSDRTFAQVLGEERLAPGTALRYETVVAEELPAGAYLVEGVLTTRPRPLRASLPIRVR